MHPQDDQRLERPRAAQLRQVKLSAGITAALDNGRTAIADGNHEAALSIFRRLADEGVAEAEHFIGWFHEQGIGGAPDRQKAFEWWSRAAEQGFAPSQHALGECYEFGLGTPKDVARACLWYLRAARNGHEASPAALDDLQAEMTPEDRLRCDEILAAEDR